jgi:hypothetical protein
MQTEIKSLFQTIGLLLNYYLGVTEQHAPPAVVCDKPQKKQTS